MNEYKLATRRHDPLSLSLFRSIISVHENQEGYRYNLDESENLDQPVRKHAIRFLKVWYSVNHSINIHVEMDHVYSRIKSRLFT